MSIDDDNKDSLHSFVVIVGWISLFSSLPFSLHCRAHIWYCRLKKALLNDLIYRLFYNAFVNTKAMHEMQAGYHIYLGTMDISPIHSTGNLIPFNEASQPTFTFFFLISSF